MSEILLWERRDAMSERGFLEADPKTTLFLLSSEGELQNYVRVLGAVLPDGFERSAEAVMRRAVAPAFCLRALQVWTARMAAAIGAPVAHPFDATTLDLLEGMKARHDEKTDAMDRVADATAQTEGEDAAQPAMDAAALFRKEAAALGRVLLFLQRTEGGQG